jgi:serine/threonine protein kinase
MMDLNNVEESKRKLCSTPNQHARPARLEIRDQDVTFHGYQEFSLAKDWIRVLSEDVPLQIKRDLLLPYFQPKYLKHRTLLDLGANAAFYCFWALQQKAERAIAVDIDEEYLDMVEKAKKQLGFGNLETARLNVADWQEPVDVVVALALVHWIYSCSADMGSLDAVVGKLAKLTKYMLIVEWIEPEDPAIQFFHHNEWNKNIVLEPYTLEAFEAAMAHHFRKVEIIGSVSPTRKLYVAFNSLNEIDISGPLPLILPKEKIVSSRLLAKEDDIEYWSCVYDDDNLIYKQATLDLAQREADFLADFNSKYFPKVLDFRKESRYSVVVLEKIIGEPMERAVEYINEKPERMFRFIEDSLSILRELKQREVVHRDIRPENILVRDGIPVLLDFGWAVSESQQYHIPSGLGGLGRPPDGSFCDVYSMGKVLEQANQGRYSKFADVIQLMAEPDVYLRITDLELLKFLFDLAYKREFKNEKK